MSELSKIKHEKEGGNIINIRKWKTYRIYYKKIPIPCYLTYKKNAKTWGLTQSLEIEVNCEKKYS